jgi:hypothetical protein
MQRGLHESSSLHAIRTAGSAAAPVRREAAPSGPPRLRCGSSSLWLFSLVSATAGTTLSRAGREEPEGGRCRSALRRASDPRYARTCEGGDRHGRARAWYGRPRAEFFRRARARAGPANHRNAEALARLFDATAQLVRARDGIRLHLQGLFGDPGSRDHGVLPVLVLRVSRSQEREPVLVSLLWRLRPIEGAQTPFHLGAHAGREGEVVGSEEQVLAICVAEPWRPKASYPVPRPLLPSAPRFDRTRSDAHRHERLDRGGAKASLPVALCAFYEVPKAKVERRQRAVPVRLS